MDLTAYTDGYCERIDPSYWAEPVNAVTNAAFVLAAFWLWPRVRGLPLARALVVVLGLIGVGSYLFHTHAQIWALIADVTPIAVFILLYLFAANRHYWGMGTGWALAGTAAFIPYAALFVPAFSNLPFFSISAAYWPVPVLILVYGGLLWPRDPALGRGLVTGGGILVVSLVFRSLDEIVCPAVPLGTHFLWHILNGIMLGWMIEVYRRQRSRTRALEGGAPQG
ncbi:MAG: ceramidase domain-containing protein [Pseudomonadota bacterium]